MSGGWAREGTRTHVFRHLLMGAGLHARVGGHRCEEAGEVILVRQREGNPASSVDALGSVGVQ